MNNYTRISPEDMEKGKNIIQNINNYYYSKMVGQFQLGTSLLVTLMCNGHILVESVPGLA